MDTSGVQQLTPTQTLRAIHPTAAFLQTSGGRRGQVNAIMSSQGLHLRAWPWIPLAPWSLNPKHAPVLKDYRR